MTDKLYWVWLQACLGVNKRFEPIIDYFGSIENLYNSNYLQRKVCPDVTDKLLDKMDDVTLDDAQKVIDLCDKEGWQIITYEDAEYPEKLKNIYDPPAVLYVCGSMPDFDNCLSIGVVGTRRASPYALKVARIMSKGIARCGGIIVSGGALGIDSAAHQGALDTNGKTVMVLGCGLAADYLSTNAKLRQGVLKGGGAVITEFQPNTSASKFTFPPRNRIISGLSDGLFVVEASNKSGSLITASYATSQNRDLYATPASIFDTKFAGTNKLIDDGAIVATSPAVILSNYKGRYPSLDMSRLATIQELVSDQYAVVNNPVEIKEQMTFEHIEQHRDNQSKITDKSLELKGNEKIVYDVLQDSFMDVDTISRLSTLDIKTVLMTLTMLELNGLVEAGVGKRYKRKQA